MKNIKYISFVIVLLLFGCDEDKFSQVKTIELPEHTPRLAVTAKLSNSFSPSTFVSHSQALLDESDYKEIANATVNIWKGDEILMDFNWDDNSRTYLPDDVLPDFEEGVTYKLEASADGYEPIVAFQELPKNCEIVNVVFTENAFVGQFGDTMSIIEVEIKDDGSTENFYSLDLFESGTFPDGSEQIFTIDGYSEDPLMEYGFDDEYFPDVTFNGGNYIMRYLIDENNLGEIFGLNSGGTFDGLVIRVNSYSKELYDYDISVQIFEDSQDIPFVEPVLISTNFDNGFGIFGLLNFTTFEYEF